MWNSILQKFPNSRNLGRLDQRHNTVDHTTNDTAQYLNANLNSNPSREGSNASALAGQIRGKKQFGSKFARGAPATAYLVQRLQQQQKHSYQSLSPTQGDSDLGIKDRPASQLQNNTMYGIGSIGAGQRTPQLQKHYNNLPMKMKGMGYNINQKNIQ